MSSKVETLTIKPNIMITYCLTAFPLTPNTWLWMTFNPDLVLNCVLRQHVWSSEAWLSKHMASLILVRNVVGELQRKRTLAVSLRQHGFLVLNNLIINYRFSLPYRPKSWRTNKQCYRTLSFEQLLKQNVVKRLLKTARILVVVKRSSKHEVQLDWKRHREF